MATPTQAYPRAGYYVAGVPHVVHEFPTKAAAVEFVAANPQAFSLDAGDAMPDAATGAPTELPEPTATESGDAGKET